jgi:hypothetical protein
MTSLLATSRKHFAAALGLHARTESVRFGAAAFPRLKSTLWQDNPPSFSMRLWKIPSAVARAAPGGRRKRLALAMGVSPSSPLPEFRQLSEFTSVLAACGRGQEKRG